METLIHFYYLGMASNMFSPIDDTTKTLELAINLSTLSPSDPNFDQWLNADGIRWADKLIIAINDGAYIIVEDGKETLFGEAYRIKDREMIQICQNGMSIEL